MCDNYGIITKDTMNNEAERKYQEKSFGEIFGSSNNVEYEIPFFQRGYVWDNKKREELLIEAVLETICEIDSPKLKDGLVAMSDKEIDYDSSNYYLGTIYLKEKEQQRPLSPGDARRYLVVDGQQRLITMYIFFVRLYYELDRDDNYEDKIEEYRGKIFNQTGDENKKSKIYTQKQDDEDLYEIIANNKKFNTNIQGNISEFSRWYDRNISKIPAESKYILFCILFSSLKVTEIILSKNDDEMLIFENLNDKGTPLRGDELLCNYIFQPIIKDNANNEEKIKQLHNDYWLKSYEEIQQLKIGNSGSRISTDEQYLFYLRTLFSIGKNKMIGKDKDVYYTFKREYKNPNSKKMEECLEYIKKNVVHLRQAIEPKIHFQDHKKHGEIIKLLTNIDKLKVYTSLTFIIPLLQNLEKYPDFLDECCRILRTLYVFLIRKSITNLPTQKDNALFPRLWEDIKQKKDKTKHMQDIFDDKGLNVNDSELEDILISLKLYEYKQSLDKFVLKEIDQYLCAENNYGETPDYTALNTVEHILPQSFSKNEDWRAYLQDEYNSNPKYNEILDNRLNTIGNLFLISRPRNSSASDELFTEKIKKYESNSGLSQDLLANYKDCKWNAEAIENRSKKLAKIAAKIWSWDID